MIHQVRLSRCLATRLSQQYMHSCAVSTLSNSPGSSFLPHPTVQYHQKRHSSFQDKLVYFYSPDFPPVGFAQRILEYVHDTTGLPWWGSILLTTMTLRTMITLPIYVYSQWNIAKLQKLQPVLKEKSIELAKEVGVAMKQYEWNEKAAKRMFNTNMKRIVREQYIQENCHPMKSFLVFWTQLPIWIGISLALRNMSGTTPFGSLAIVSSVRPEMCIEGMLWFTNFVTPDPLWILPAIFSLSSLANVEVMGLSKPDGNKIQKVLQNVFRGVSLLMFPIGIIMPSCMVYYWSCSSIYALTQTLVTLSPRVKSILKLPTMSFDSNTPYKQIIVNAKQRYGNRFRRKRDSDDTPL